MRSLLLLGFMAMSLPAAAADVELLGIGTLPGTSSDLSGLKGNASDGTPLNRLGGLGSAIDYTGKDDLYVLASDRGPKDGAVDFACRMHLMQIQVQPGAKQPVTLTLKQTTLLKDEQDQPFTGAMKSLDTRLDPEGIRISPTGTTFISDEYGPFIWEFNAAGKRLRRLALPSKFAPVQPAKNVELELPPHNKMGRVPNRGLEGLALSTDGKFLLAAMQSPLIQDGALNEKNERVGLHVRLLKIDLKTSATAEFICTLDHPSNGINEIVALTEHEFLIIERDGKAGPEAEFKKIMKIDLRNATNVSTLDQLSAQLPPSIKPVTKELFIDLLDPKYAIAVKDCPEKFEGLTFGPKLADGRRMLLVTADNDFIAEQSFRVYAFAVK